MSMRVSYKKQVLFGVMLLAVLFGVAEGLSYTYVYFSIFHPVMSSVGDLDRFTTQGIYKYYGMIDYEYSTGHRQIVPNQHNDIINVNSHGFRGPEFSESKPDDTYRIFVLGGSTIYGIGLHSDHSTIPGHLQAMYDGQDTPFKTEVINVGIEGASSFTEHWMVKTKFLDMSPDLFIIYDGWNDATITTFDLKNLSERITPDVTESDGDTAGVFDYIYGEIVSERKVARILVNMRDAITPPPIRDPTYDNIPIDEKVSVWVDRWNEICNIGKERGFDVMVVVQPMLGSGNYTLDSFATWAYHDNHNDVLLERLEHYADALHSFEPCATTLDLRYVLDGVKRPVYFDGGHLNDFGNKIVASAIFEKSYPIVVGDQ